MYYNDPNKKNKNVKTIMLSKTRCVGSEKW